MSGSASSSSYDPKALGMPSARAAFSAFSRTRDAIAVTCDHCPRCMAGMTFAVAIFAAPSTPQRILSIESCYPSRRPRGVVMFLTALVSITLMFAGTMPAMQQPQLPTRKTLTLEVARRIAAAAEVEARRNNWAVSIAVLDDAGHLMVFHRMDGAKLVATDIAIRKARTAVYFQGPTKSLEEEVSGGRTALLPIDGFMPLEGGIPLMVD